MKALVDFYAAEYERVFGAKPLVNGGTAKAAQAILGGRDLEAAKRLVTEHLTSPPTWYADRGLYDLRHVAQAANTLIARGQQ